MRSVIAGAMLAFGCTLDPESIADESESESAGEPGPASTLGDDAGAGNTGEDPGVTSVQPGESGDAGGGSGTSEGPGSDGDGDVDDSGSGTSTGPVTTDCGEILAMFEAETDAIRSCSSPTQCGQVLLGTSCGCTHDWVARLDADTEQWFSLVDTATRMECRLPFFSVCDCPGADGFACVEQTCTWNYGGGG